MSDRRFDVSGVQITASVLAAVSGAVLASYLGVAGTVIGTAVMSVAGTAGTAIYKHYLGRTARRVRETATVAAAHRAAEWMTVGTRTTAGHTAAHRAGHPGAAAANGPPGGGGADAGAAAGQDRETSHDAGATEEIAAARDTRGAGATGATRDTGTADTDTADTGTGETGTSGDSTAAGGTGQDGGSAAPRPGWLARYRAAVRGWPRWAQVAAASAMVFIGVIGAVTVVEVAAGKPLQTVVWNHKASGTTVGNLVGGRPSHTSPATTHPRTSHPASSSPAPASTRTGPASPSPSPSSSSLSPSPSPTSSTSSPPASSSPSPDPTGTGTATGTPRASTR